MLISLTNNVTGTSERMFYQLAFWKPLSLVELTCKINHHSPRAHTCLKLSLSSERGLTGSQPGTLTIDLLYL